MSLHNQIMELPTQDRHLEDWSNTRMAWLAGFDTGLHEAAQLAKEADELMAEMAQTLEELRDYDRNNKSEALSAYKSILETLGNYHHFKESTK